MNLNLEDIEFSVEGIEKIEEHLKQVRNHTLEEDLYEYERLELLAVFPKRRELQQPRDINKITTISITFS